MESGIYCITNLINENKYIGKDSNISKQKRWKRHIWDLNKLQDTCSVLQNAWNKYGKENFKYEIIEYCNKEVLNDREIYWIKELNTRVPNGYNITPGGNGNSDFLKETKQKISNALSGENHPLFGTHRSEETKRKISIALSGSNHPNYGKPMPEETKRKIGIANSGENCSEETRQKLRIANSGEKGSNFGKHLSEETKQKMRDSSTYLYGEDNPRFGSKNKDATSKYHGVSKTIHEKKYVYWEAAFKDNGKKIYIGNYETESEAAKAYDEYIIANGLPNPLNFTDEEREKIIINTDGKHKKHKNSSSVYYGVSSYKKGKYFYWRAITIVDGKQVHIGSYSTELEAALAYNDYVISHNLPNPLNELPTNAT